MSLWKAWQILEELWLPSASFLLLLSFSTLTFLLWTCEIPLRSKYLLRLYLYTERLTHIAKKGSAWELIRFVQGKVFINCAFSSFKSQYFLNCKSVYVGHDDHLHLAGFKILFNGRLNLTVYLCLSTYNAW